MPNLADMSPDTRFELISSIAADLYGAAWKSKLADDFGLSNQTLTNWRKTGAPIWIARAMVYAERAAKLDALMGALEAAKV